MQNTHSNHSLTLFYTLDWNDSRLTTVKRRIWKRFLWVFILMLTHRVDTMKLFCYCSLWCLAYRCGVIFATHNSRRHKCVLQIWISFYFGAMWSAPIGRAYKMDQGKINKRAKRINKILIQIIVFRLCFCLFYLGEMTSKVAGSKWFNDALWFWLRLRRPQIISRYIRRTAHTHTHCVGQSSWVYVCVRMCNAILTSFRLLRRFGWL